LPGDECGWILKYGVELKKKITGSFDSSSVHPAVGKVGAIKQTDFSLTMADAAYSNKKVGCTPAGDEKMKVIGTVSAKTLFGMTAAALLLIAGSAPALDISPELRAAALQAMPDDASNTAIQHCGCDNKKGIEMYVQNLINDAKKRGLSCEASLHIPACITTYCSICKGHEGLVENCIKTGVEYFSNSPELCSQQQKGVAFSVPDMQFLSQFMN
jgi:hypothetical protein